MTNEKWQELVGRIQDQFQVISHDKEPRPEGEGTVESIVFQNPLGRLKLERTVYHKIIGERGMGSKRIGGDVQIQKIRSADEVIDFLEGFKWNEATEAWDEIKPEQLGL